MDARLQDYEHPQATTANTRLAAGIRTVLMLLALELGVFWHDIRSLLASVACKQNTRFMCAHMRWLSCVHVGRHEQVPAGVDKLAIAHGPIHTHKDTNAHFAGS